MLIENYFLKVFKRTKMTIEMEHLMYQEIDKAEVLVADKIKNGMSKKDAQKEVLRTLGDASTYCENLNLPQDKLLKSDYLFYGLVQLQKLMMLLVVIYLFIPVKSVPARFAYLLTILGNRIKLIIPLLVIALLLNIIMHVFLFHFTNDENIKSNKYRIIATGVITLPLGFFSILIGFMTNQTRLDAINVLRARLFHSKSMKPSWIKKTLSALSIILVITLFSVVVAGSLVREVVTDEFYHLKVVHTSYEGNAGMNFYGNLLLEPIDESKTRVVPELLPSVHSSYFPENSVVMINYELNGHKAYTEDRNYFRSQGLTDYNDSFIVEENVNDIIKNPMLLFRFTYTDGGKTETMVFIITNDSITYGGHVKETQLMWVWDTRVK